MISWVIQSCLTRSKGPGKEEIIRGYPFVEVRGLKLKVDIEMHNLRGLFWNSEGFRDPGKHLFVNESIRERKLDFIALSETGRSNFATPFLNHLSYWP